MDRRCAGGKSRTVASTAQRPSEYGKWGERERETGTLPIPNPFSRPNNQSLSGPAFLFDSYLPTQSNLLCALLLLALVGAACALLLLVVLFLLGTRRGTFQCAT